MKRTIVARGGKRGKTAGRGGKGQSARAGNKRRPEWRDIIKRIPKLRGRGVNLQKSIAERPVVINLAALDVAFSAKDIVSPATLIEKGLVSTKSGYNPMVKILGDGDVTKAFNVSGCSISESAKEKIVKAGGTVTPLKSTVVAKVKKSGPSIKAPETAEKKEAKKAPAAKEKAAPVKAEKKDVPAKAEKKPVKKEAKA